MNTESNIDMKTNAKQSDAMEISLVEAKPTNIDTNMVDTHNGNDVQPTSIIANVKHDVQPTVANANPTVQPTAVRPTAVQPTDVQPTDVQPTIVQPTIVQPTHVQPSHVQPAATSTYVPYVNLVKKLNGMIVAKEVIPLPVKKLPHLVASGVISTTAIVELERSNENVSNKDDKQDDKQTDKQDDKQTDKQYDKDDKQDTHTTIDLKSVVYEQQPKSQVEQEWQNDVTRKEMGAWFQHKSRAAFCKQLLTMAYSSLYNKPLHLLIIDAQDEVPIVPSFNTQVRKLGTKDFKALSTRLGEHIVQKLTHLPNRLTDNWFPIILIHCDNNIHVTFISFALLPYPDSPNWQKWPAQQLQHFLVDFLVNSRPIEIVSSLNTKKPKNPEKRKKQNMKSALKRVKEMQMQSQETVTL